MKTEASQVGVDPISIYTSSYSDLLKENEILTIALNKYIGVPTMDEFGQDYYYADRAVQLVKEMKAAAARRDRK